MIDSGPQRAVAAGADAHAARGLQRAPPAEVVVEEQPEADLPARPQPLGEEVAEAGDADRAQRFSIGRAITKMNPA